MIIRQILREIFYGLIVIGFLFCFSGAVAHAQFGNDVPQEQTDSFWHYFNTALGILVLGGIGHLVIIYGRVNRDIGQMKTKLDTMWNTFTKERL